MSGPATYSGSGVNIQLGDDVSRILYNASKQTWNMGQGMVVITPKPDEVIKYIGRVAGEPKIRIKNRGAFNPDKTRELTDKSPYKKGERELAFSYQ